MKSWDREDGNHVQLIDEFVNLSARLAGIAPDQAELVKKELHRYMSVQLQRRKYIPASLVRFHTEWYREFYRTLGVRDPYRTLKTESNQRAAGILAALGIRGLREAAHAAILANRLDFGVGSLLANPLTIAAEDFQDLAALPLFADDFAAMEVALREARSVLLLADNNGEVLFDRVLLGEIRRLNPGAALAIAGKEAPMLNDVTVDELESLGFREVASIVSTGSNCFGVPDDEVSPEFRRALREADVVIAKGQAYLEFWLQFDVAKVFHLVHTKFEIVDTALGRVPPRRNLVLASRRYAAGKPAYPGLPRSGDAAMPEEKP